MIPKMLYRDHVLMKGAYFVPVAELFDGLSVEYCESFKGVVFNELTTVCKRFLQDLSSFTIMAGGRAWNYANLFERFRNYYPQKRDYRYPQPLIDEEVLPWEQFPWERFPTAERIVEELAMVFWLEFIRRECPELEESITLSKYEESKRFPPSVDHEWQTNIRRSLYKLWRFARYMGVPRPPLVRDKKRYKQMPIKHYF